MSSHLGLCLDTYHNGSSSNNMIHIRMFKFPSMPFHLNWAWAQSRCCDQLYYVASDIIIDYIPLNFTLWSEYFRNKVSSNMLLNNLMNGVTYWLSVWVLSMWAKNPLAVQDNVIPLLSFPIPSFHCFTQSTN